MQPPQHRKKYLFIDDAWVVAASNLRRTTNQARKHAGPVLELNAPWDTPTDEFNGINVLFDPQDRLFKMWYGVSSRWVDWGGASNVTAYATSSDGIHWEKPILGLVECNGSRENNYLTRPDLENFGPSIIIDPGDEAVRRFKMIFAACNIYDSQRVTDWARHHVPLNLACSEDGIHWDRPGFVNPVLRGISDGEFTFFHDVARRKFQVFARRVPNLPRDISLYESFDLVNWEDCGRVFVAGDEQDPPTLYNIHGTCVLPCEDHRLALLNAMHHHPKSEELGVFQTPPDDYPGKDRIGLLDLQLGYSNDGRQWHRAHDRTPLLTVGTGDDVDAGMIFPQKNAPIDVDGDTYIYCSAHRSRHTAWSRARADERVDGDLRRAGCATLAVMPEDHWVSLDAGAQEGVLLAGPWRVLPHRMFLNADARDGSIEVEIVDAYERPLPGLGRADSIPISADGKDQEVRWTGDLRPDQVEGDYRGGFMARIHLRRAKLYSCTLAHPDPDGTVRRYWANYQWNRNIFHRNDQWGRDSNLPAGGVPPVTRGMPNY